MKKQADKGRGEKVLSTGCFSSPLKMLFKRVLWEKAEINGEAVRCRKQRFSKGGRRREGPAKAKGSPGQTAERHPHETERTEGSGAGVGVGRLWRQRLFLIYE